MNHHQTLDTRMLDELLGALGTDAEAQALSALCAEAKREKARTYIAAHIDQGGLCLALHDGAPKARKNAARLMGALGLSAFEPTLLEALAVEKTRFVRPSILLALGAVGTDAARAALSALPPPQAEGPEDEKHTREEAEALRRALASLTRHEAHAFAGLKEARELHLRCPEGFESYLVEELRQNNNAGQTLAPGIVSCKSADMQAVFRARCFFEALFPMAANLPPQPDEVAAHLRVPLVTLLGAMHEGTAPFSYRVEYRGGGDRAAFISTLASAMDCPELMNSPSSYEAELRLVPGKEDNTLDATCKLFTYADTRFFYRKQALPASIHPVAAACIARLADALQPRAKRVLDPCCGSGTLLIEYGLLHKDVDLTGMDLNESALRLARENLGAAQLRCGLIHMDLARFAARAPYELVLANLPFGNRVGNHKENERLYQAFAAKLVDWLAPHGHAILYTMEHSLLRRCIQPHKQLRFVTQLKTEAGGLNPQVLAVRKEG